MKGIFLKTPLVNYFDFFPTETRLRNLSCQTQGAASPPANMLVLRTSNFLGAAIRPIVPRHKHSIVPFVHH